MAKEKPLTIDLNTIFNPDPAIIAAYKAADPNRDFYPYEQTPNYINEKRIFAMSKAKNPATPIKHRIQAVYRKKVGNAEKCFFFEHLSTRDYWNNYVDHTRQCGTFQLPVFGTHFGMDTNAYEQGRGEPVGPTAIATEIVEIETKYLWDWEQIKPQLQKWYDEAIIDPESTTYIAQEGTKKYSVNSWDQFYNLKFEDLVMINKVGDKAAGLFDRKSADTDLLSMIRDVAKQELTKSLKNRSISITPNNHGQGRTLDKVEF